MLAVILVIVVGTTRLVEKNAVTYFLPWRVRFKEFCGVVSRILVRSVSRTNKLAEGRNGRGLVVLDVEKAVQFGDLEQVADPFGDVHQL